MHIELHLENTITSFEFECPFCDNCIAPRHLYKNDIKTAVGPKVLDECSLKFFVAKGSTYTAGMDHYAQVPALSVDVLFDVFCWVILSAEVKA